MAVFRLNNEIVFPNPELSEEDGLLAIGGDLSVERLILAYCNGIFPWYNPERKYYGGALNQGLLFTQVKLKYQIP